MKKAGDGLQELYGRQYMIFEPLDCIAKLASLVPNPKVNLTRFSGVFVQKTNTEF